MSAYGYFKMSNYQIIVLQCFGTVVGRLVLHVNPDERPPQPCDALPVRVHRRASLAAALLVQTGLPCQRRPRLVRGRQALIPNPLLGRVLLHGPQEGEGQGVVLRGLLRKQAQAAQGRAAAATGDAPGQGERNFPSVQIGAEEGGAEKCARKNVSVKVAAWSIKKSFPLKDSPPTKTNKGAGPLSRLFSPAPKKAKKVAAKIEETVSLTEAAPTRKKAGGFYDNPSPWGTLPSAPPLPADARLVSWHTTSRSRPRVARLASAVLAP